MRAVAGVGLHHLGRLPGDDAGLDQRVRVATERAHVVLAGIHQVGELAKARVPDGVAHRRRRNQRFDHWNATVAVRSRHQLLRDDASHRGGEPDAADLALVLGQQCEDLAHRRDDVGRRHHGDDEAACLRRLDGVIDRARVPEVAQDHHVGILSQRRAQADLGVVGVNADLALGDRGVEVPVQELDRVFDDDDVPLVPWLMWCTIAATVELLPLPLTPVTRTRPRSDSASCCTDAGSERDSIVGSVNGMTRITIMKEERCRRMLMRKRPTPGRPQLQSKSRMVSSCFRASSVPTRRSAMARVWSGVSRCLVRGESFPLTRARKTSPALM
jgi:hypothetical protein